MISIGILFGILVLVPIALGNILQNILQEDSCWPVEWVKGFVVELAIYFMGFLLWSKCSSYNFRLHSIIFAAIMLGVCMIRCFFLLAKRKSSNRKFFCYKSRCQRGDFLLMAGILLLMCVVIYSGVTTGIPEDSQDNTLEVINAVWKSNTVGKINPYTGGLYLTDQMIYREPIIAVFWASLSWLTRLHPAVLTGVVLPVFFIGLFYAFCYSTSLWLWRNNRRKSEIFILSILVLHVLGSRRKWLLFYHLQSESWLGEHILFFLLLPMLLFEVVKIGGIRIQTKKNSLFLAVLSIVTFLISENSWFYMAVMLTLSVIMYIGRKLWDC